MLVFYLHIQNNIYIWSGKAKDTMKYVDLPEKMEQRLPFYLAMEEYVARHLDEDECFFMWQVEPTVIFGRNQLIESEVNLDYCRRHGIQTYRRKSGGGCVYADKDNIMFSYIVRADNVNFTFDRYLRMVAFVLRKLGVPAEASGRNDILIEGRKVSGNAFYHLPGKSIVHGTMLFDTDMEHLIRAITPSDEKLVSKGIRSVRQRVVNLREFVDIDIEAFKRFVREQLCNDTICLSPADVEGIKELEKEYLDEAFIYGRNPRYALTRRGKVLAAGELEVRLELKGGVVKKINLLGDYFLLGDLDNALLKPLIGLPFREEEFRHVLTAIRPETVVRNLDTEHLLDILFEH